MKIRAKWVGASAIVLAAIITSISKCGSAKSNAYENKAKQSNNSGANNNAGRDLDQSGRDLIKGDQVTVYQSVDSGQAKNGDTYNVTSNNQHGGITAGKVIIIKEATIVSSEGGKNISRIKEADNFLCEVDTFQHIIKVQPKEGSWQNTFLGFPLREKESVSAFFSSTDRRIEAMRKLNYEVRPDSIYAMTTEGNPATNMFFYSLKYRALPTYIVFGNYPGPLYKAELKFSQ